MSTPIYDPRAFVKRLTEAGMSERQADTLANENLLLIAEHLANKDDLKALETSLRAEMAQMRTAINAEFGLVRAEIAQLRIEFTGEFELVRAEMTQLRAEFTGEFELVRAEMSTLESRLVAKLGGLMAAMLAAFAAVVKLL